ncbi:hypothetical protein ACHAXT_011787 [Thalassiosira profunda]
MNWRAPTPVQRLAVPAILDMADGDGGASLWCEGPTGSGVALYHCGRILTLILSPTRELAAQTASVLQRLASYLPNSKRFDVIHGGVPVEPQVARLAKRRREGTDVDVLVATPGRLVDVLQYGRSGDDPTLAALERRIVDALDEKATGGGDDAPYDKRRKRKGKGRRRGPARTSSLTLNDIQEMDLDRVDDDGRGSLDEMLRSLQYLVVDEADRLLGGAFKSDVDELLSLFPRREETELKTLLFSATFPEQIEERVDRVLSRLAAGVPLRVSTTASMRQRVPESGGDDADGTTFEEEAAMSNRQKKHQAHTTPISNVLPDAAPDIRHRVIRLEERHRTQALRLLLNQQADWDRVLVFVATRYSAEHVARKLRRYDIAAAELHGKLDQAARERRLKAFRAGRTRVLITTDLSARGLDVENLPATHRTGRTGRAGKSGAAVTFVSAASEAHFDLIERKELRGREPIEREVLPEFAPDEDAWQIAATAATMSVPGAAHSERGLEHDKMFGGVKGRRKSKKDRLREKAAAAAAAGKEK